MSITPKATSRLYTPTAASTNGKYKKPSTPSKDDIVIAWSTSTPKSSTLVKKNSIDYSIVSETKSEPILKPVRRHSTDVSSRLLSPTKATENGKYKTQSSSSSRPITPKTPGSVSVSPRLLAATKSQVNGKYKAPEQLPVQKTVKRTPITSRLLTPTKATEAGIYKKPVSAAA